MRRETFKYGKYSYEYFVVKEPRKTVSLTIKPNLVLVLKCPVEYTEEKINKFLKRKWLWIEKQVSYFEKFKKDIIKKEYISGESFLYLGRQYKLVVSRAKQDQVSLTNGRLQVFTTNKVRDGKCNKRLVKKWYRDRANKIFEVQYKEVLKKFDYNFIPDFLIRKMDKRWGSFLSSQKIILNPRLIHASKDCIDYVIIHELCHITHRQHNKDFYKLLESKLNNWQELKDKLEYRFL